MKTAIALLALFAVGATFGNPAANTEWRWKSRMPTVTPNPRLVPFHKFMRPAEKQPRIPGTKTVEGCGPTKVSTDRIVGGTEAVPHSYPWQVALFIDDTYFCGGSIINEEWVLTAGHCLHEAISVEVVAGAHNLQENEDSQLTILTTDLHPHEQYNPISLANDVSLLRLPTPLNFNEYIAPVCLPAYSDTDLPVGTIVNPTGWGKTTDGALGGISDTLNSATNPIISFDACHDVYGFVITESVMCTDTTGGIGTCSGDSGGPVNYVSGGVTYTRGVTSFVHSDGCTSGNPDGFARVTSFLDWIETKTGILIDA